MLSKLLKYEIKDTARVIPFFYLIALIFAAMVVLAKKIGFDWFRVTSSVLLIVVGFAIIIVTFVVVVLRFYKNLYSDEGYLMFTLPVKPQLLLTSKTIVAYVWMVLSVLAFIAAFSVGLYGFGVDDNMLKNIMSEFERLGLKNVIFPIIALLLVQLLYLLGQIYFAITMANRPAFHGMGAASAFLVFIATYVVLQIVEAVITIFAPLSLDISMAGNVDISLSTKNMFGFLMDNINGVVNDSFNIGLGGYIFQVIMVFVLLFLTGRMMNKKVSLR